ncbi:MAG: enoyl-[acyl-carrier-protein] reductase FabV [Pseudomonadota bacterium]|jgi:enoyl-[acyl-carrier protein] reductase/trans-2-enoyl-CoA reductase (NAD+)
MTDSANPNVRVIPAKTKGFISINSHPTGCTMSVNEWADRAKSKPTLSGLGAAPKALILGGTTGYGLATRVVLAENLGASTISVGFDAAASESRPATAGWYNTYAFHARNSGSGKHFSLNGDAFAQETRESVVKLIKEKFGKISIFVYSIAAPRRKDPTTGTVYSSVLKPVGAPYSGLTVELDGGKLSMASLQPASEEEIANTTKVMGGEDLLLWVEYLKSQGVAEDNLKVVAYTYEGPSLSWPVYKDGTIGKAKDDVKAKCVALNRDLAKTGGLARVAYLQATVTQASLAIPTVPLYVAVYSKIMRENGLFEDNLDHVYRMLELLGKEAVGPDTDVALRVDDRELQTKIQSEVTARMSKLAAGTVLDDTHFSALRGAFLNLFGFEMPGVDYAAPVDTLFGKEWPSA